MVERRYGKFFDSHTVNKDIDQPVLELRGFLEELKLPKATVTTLEKTWAPTLKGYSPEMKAEQIWSLFRELQRVLWRHPKKEKMLPAKEKKGRSSAADTSTSEHTIDLDLDLDDGGTVSSESVPSRAQVVAADQSMLERAVMLQLLWEDKEAKDLFQRQYRRHLEEEEDLNGEYVKYRALHQDIGMLEKEHDGLMTELFSHRGKETPEMSLMRLETIRIGLAAARAELEKMMRENPELAARIDYEKILGYKRELEQTGFAWFPSRRQFLEKLEAGLLSGRPIMVMSESGAGKTTIVGAAAERLTGIPMSRATGGKHTRPERLFYGQKLSGDESHLQYGPFLEAISGKETNLLQEKVRHDGRIFLDDEFNNRSSDDQLEIVKALSGGLTPGRKFQVPNTTIREDILPHSAYIAAGNPPSDRYDREATDPAVLREFGDNILSLDYPEQQPNNPELFDFLRACLMRGNRLPPLSVEMDLGPAWITEATSGKQRLDTDPKHGGYLWRFANAWRDLFNAYQHQTTLASHQRPSDPVETYYLETLLLDLGIVRSWLEEWKTTKRLSPLDEFLQKKLSDQLAAPTVSEHDRTAAAAILKAYDIHLQTTAAPASGAPKSRLGKRNLSPKDVGFLSPNVPRSLLKEGVRKPKTIKIIDREGNDLSFTTKIPDDIILGTSLTVFARDASKKDEVFIVAGSMADGRIVLKDGRGRGVVMEPTEVRTHLKRRKIVAEDGTPIFYTDSKVNYGELMVNSKKGVFLGLAEGSNVWVFKDERGHGFTLTTAEASFWKNASRIEDPNGQDIYYSPINSSSAIGMPHADGGIQRLELRGKSIDGNMVLEDEAGKGVIMSEADFLFYKNRKIIKDSSGEIIFYTERSIGALKVGGRVLADTSTGRTHLKILGETSTGNVVLEGKGGVGIVMTPAEIQAAIDQEKNKTGLSPKEAEQILGQKRVIGVGEVRSVWGDIDKTKVPPIPFTRRELEIAAQEDKMLVFRVNTDKDGQPLTVRRMHELLTPRMKKIIQKAKKQAEDLHKQMSMPSNWTVGKEPVPRQLIDDASLLAGSGKDYLDQECPTPGWAFISTSTKVQPEKRNSVADVVFDVATILLTKNVWLNGTWHTDSIEVDGFNHGGVAIKTTITSL